MSLPDAKHAKDRLVADNEPIFLAFASTLAADNFRRSAELLGAVTE